MFRNQRCWEMGDFRVKSAEDALCGSHEFQHNFRLIFVQRCIFCWKLLVLLKSPERYFPLVAPILLSQRSVLNTPKSIGVPIAKKIQRIGPGDCAGQLTGPPGPSHYSLKVWQYRETEVVPHHAWTTCVVNKDAHPKVLVNNSPKIMVQPGKTTGPKSWSPKMPTVALMEIRCSRLDDTAMWELSSTQTWVPWKFTGLSVVNLASSVTGYSLQTVCLQHNLHEVTGKTLSLHDGQEGWGRAFSGCSTGRVTEEFSRQRKHRYLQQL
jgi:hypothetical protein